MRELLLEIGTSVRRNKLRTALTGFSVAWGIFMLTILLGSGNGLRHGVMANFGDYAVNSINLWGGSTSKPWHGHDKYRRIRLSYDDLGMLAAEFPEVLDITASVWYPEQTATAGRRHMRIELCGTLPEIARIEGRKLSAGRFLNRSDVEQRRKSVVIDESLRRVLFDGQDPTGRELRIGRSVFTIVGVERSDANRSMACGYIPLTTGRLLYAQDDPRIDNILFTVRDLDTDAAMEAFEERLRTRLAQEHDFDPTDRNAVWLSNNMTQHKDMMRLFGGIETFIWIIGLGTLLAGVVGVSNIMLVTVAERTHEFGVRKALGASPASIIRLILTESVCVTAAFGYLGMVLGTAIMEGVNYLMERTPDAPSDFGTIFLDPTIDLSTAASATLVLVAAGLIAGYVPARRAARLKTIDALRHNK